MSQTLAANLRMTDRGDGRYEFDAGTDWWGYIAQFGGYAMAAVLHAMIRRLDRSDLRPRVFTHQFLRGMPEGPCSVDVDVVRSGRGSGQVLGRLHGNGQLCGTSMASFVADREAPTFDDEPVPVVEPVGVDEQPRGFEVGAAVYDRVHVHPRFDEGVRPEETGGWITLVESEPTTPELVLCLSDLWLPPAIRHADRSGAMFSFTHEAWLNVRDTEPTAILSRHRNPRADGGLLDENISLWSNDGRVLCRATQRRLYSAALAGVEPPEHVRAGTAWPQQGI